MIAEESRRTRQLLLICAVEVLAMGLWFSASAVVPQLSDDWHLSDAGATWLTTSVQLGFVAGALSSAILNLPDRMSPVRLIGLAALAGAAANEAVALLAHGLALAIPLRFLTGVALAGVYPPGIKLMATWFRAGRGLAVGALVGALALGSGTPHLVNALPALDWQAVLSVASALAVVGAGVAVVAVREGPLRRGGAPRFTRGTCGGCSATAPSGWSASATSATCGSSTRCGRGCPPTPPRASPHRATAIRPGRRSSWRHSRRSGSPGWPAACSAASRRRARPGHGHDGRDGGQRDVLRRGGGGLRRSRPAIVVA